MTIKERLDLLVATSAAKAKALSLLINGNAPSLSALTTIDKSNLVSAINEINAKPGSSIVIDDVVPSTTKVYSSAKTATEIAGAVAALVNSAPSTLDTIGEVAAELSNNSDAVTALFTAVGFRVRFDAPQALTTPQKQQALENIGGVSAAELGWIDTDLAAAFEAALL